MNSHGAQLNSPPLVGADYVFIGLLIINFITVCYLGRDIFIQGDKLEQARKNGEVVMVWANQIDEKIASGKSIDPKACTPASEADLKKPNFIANTWGYCLGALFGPTGKFSDFRNHFMKDGLLWTKKCDREHVQSKGALVFLHLTSGPTGAPVLSEIKESDVLVSGTEFRVNICDRGFRLIKIGDAKL